MIGEHEDLSEQMEFEGMEDPDEPQEQQGFDGFHEIALGQMTHVIPRKDQD